MLGILILSKCIQKESQEKIKKLAKNLDFDGIEFPVQEKDFRKIETKNNIYNNIPIYVSDQKFENSMDLLHVIDADKLHYVYIKDFNGFMFHKTKNKNKKHFCCFQCFSSKNVLTEHKEVCLGINGAQSVRLEKGTMEFINSFKQISVPFKIYVDFECNLKTVEIYEGSYSKKYEDHDPCSFAYKFVCIDDRFNKPIVVFRDKNAAYEFIKAILEEYKYCKK